MPYCSNCGSKLGDTAAFCQTCGNKVKAAQPKEALQPQVQPQATYASRITPMSVLKQTVSSPLFLICSIAFTAAIVLNIIRSADIIYMVPGLYELLYAMADSLGLYEVMETLEELYELEVVQNLNSYSFGFMAAGAMLCTFIASIPSMLCALGMWLTYAQGANKRREGFKTGGLTLIQVLAVISLVLICIMFALVGISLILGCFIAAAYPGTFAGTVILFAVFLVVVAAAVLAVMYYVKLLKMIRSVKNVARTGTSEAYASVYVALWCFISAGCVGMSLASIFGAVSMLAALCTMVADICLGAVIISYKNKMDKIARNAQSNI